MKTHHVAMFPLLAMIAMSGVPRTLVAQHGDAAPSLASTAPKDASQLAFLIGQWEVAATKGPTTLAMRIHGAPKIVGS